MGAQRRAAHKHPANLCCDDGITRSMGNITEPLVHCANTSTSPLASARLQKKRGARKKPIILVMQLATPNIWGSYCRFSTAINSAWAQLQGHHYLVTPGDYLEADDIWRGGNVRAVLEVMSRIPDDVDWIFHLDCDAAFVDFSGGDALYKAIKEFATPKTEVILSRDESGFAGTSRLTNMGTGLWRRSTWTSRLLQRWWDGILIDKAKTEQEILEDLLKQNTMECLDRISLLPAGRLNSESANPISSPPRLQPIIHLAGMPNDVRSIVLEKVWSDLCQTRSSMNDFRGPDPDAWTLREVLLTEFRKHVDASPDENLTSIDDWTQVSAPARNARRLALAYLRGGRDRVAAENYFVLALKRAVSLEASIGHQPRFAHAVAGFVESLAGPLLELGRTSEARNLLQRPWPKHALVARHPLDELMRSENLCAAFQAEGRLKEAEIYARKALRGMEEAFPVSARDVRPAGARARLAQVVHSQGLWKEAEPLLRGALQGYELSLGFDHPETLGCARNLAVLLKQMPQERHRLVLPEADSLLQRAVKGYSKRLGTEHPETQRAEKNLKNFRRWRSQRERQSLEL